MTDDDDILENDDGGADGAVGDVRLRLALKPAPSGYRVQAVEAISSKVHVMRASGVRACNLGIEVAIRALEAVLAVDDGADAAELEPMLENALASLGATKGQRQGEVMDLVDQATRLGPEVSAPHSLLVAVAALLKVNLTMGDPQTGEFWNAPHVEIAERAIAAWSADRGKYEAVNALLAVFGIALESKTTTQRRKLGDEHPLASKWRAYQRNRPRSGA